MSCLISQPTTYESKSDESQILLVAVLEIELTVDLQDNPVIIRVDKDLGLMRGERNVEKGEYNEKKTPH